MSISSRISRILLPLLILVPAAGCSPPLPTGYHTYTLGEGVGHFSFEYPAWIPVKTVTFGEDGNYTAVDMLGPFSSSDRTRTRIWVTVTRDPKEPVNVQKYFDDAFRIAESLSNYRFIDRSDLTVAGKPAEQMVYANLLHRSDYETRVLHLESYTVINRMVYLKHADAVWTISMTASEAAYPAELPGFEHLLSTFAFLN